MTFIKVQARESASGIRETLVNVKEIAFVGSDVNGDAYIVWRHYGHGSLRLNHSADEVMKMIAEAKAK